MDGDSALVTLRGHSVPLVFRLPLALLPAGIQTGMQPSYNPPSHRLPMRCCAESSATLRAPLIGHVIDMTTRRNVSAQDEREQDVRSLQAELRARLGGAPTAEDVLHAGAVDGVSDRS